MIKFNSIRHFSFFIFHFSFLLLTATSYAQDSKHPQERQSPDDSRHQRVEALKIGFITEKLNLTPEEAKAFWPVYNQYEKERGQLRKSKRENLSNAKMNFDEMSNAEVEKVVDYEMALRQSELDLLKTYHAKFKEVLPIKKVARLYKAQEDFKRELIGRIREKRGEEGGKRL